MESEIERVRGELASIADDLWRLGQRDLASTLVLHWVRWPIGPGPVRATEGETPNERFYGRVVALADVLWANGAREPAASLIDDMASGATRGEIWGALRMHLGTLRQSDETRRLGLESAIDEILDPIEDWHRRVSGARG